MIRAYKFVVLSLTLFLGVAGCSGDGAVKGPKLAAVKGTVTLDGDPMASGEVMFVQGGGVGTAQVTNGAFSGEAPVGECVVQIYSYRESTNVVEMGGEKFGGGKENFIPAQFNAQSTMKVTVGATGTSDLKYEVTSK